MTIDFDIRVANIVNLVNTFVNVYHKPFSTNILNMAYAIQLPLIIMFQTKNNFLCSLL